MDFISTIKLSLKGIIARRGRSFLTILGIVIGVMSVIMIVSIGAGAQALILSQVTKLGSNLLNVLPGKSNETGPPAAVFGVKVTTLSTEDYEALLDTKRFPDILAVSPLVRGQATVVAGEQSIDTEFSATTASNAVVQDIPIEEGDFFRAEDERSGAPVIVLGADVRDQLFPDTSPLGKVVKVKNIPFRVVGVAKRQGATFFQNLDDQVYIPFKIGQRQLLGISYIDSIRIKVSDATKLDTVREDIKVLLRERHHISNPDNDDFSVRNLADALKILTGITDALRGFLALMAGISLVVGGIGIMNIMLVTVQERTREIGLRKALGARNKDIRFLFLIESVILTLSGGVIGIFLGITFSYIIALGARSAGYDWAFVVSPFAIALSVGIASLTGILFGLYPAIKASKLDPINALRYE